MKDKAFTTITNKDIYQEIKGLRTDFEIFRDVNCNDHNRIIVKHQKNRADIDFVRYIAIGALGIGLFLSSNLIIKLL